MNLQKRTTMSAESDRAWPVPRAPWVLRMTWSELLFAHWPVDPQLIASRLPAGLSVDTRDAKLGWVWYRF